MSGSDDQRPGAGADDTEDIGFEDPDDLEDVEDAGTPKAWPLLRVRRRARVALKRRRR